MLTSLTIDNFRAFKRLEMPDLGRVNVIVGENGSGKTCVLEAVELLIFSGYRNVLAGQLIRRKEVFLKKAEEGARDMLDARHLFHGYSYEIGACFSIQAKAEVEVICEGELLDRKCFAFMESSFQKEGWKHGEAAAALRIRGWDGESYIPVSKEGGISRFQPTPLNPKHAHGRGKPHFTCAHLTESGILAELWDDILLSPSEDSVVDSLKIIDSRVDKIAVRSDGIFLAKTEGCEWPLPVGNLGSGLELMLSIALNLVDSEGAVVFIDEIDTGLHYSVMEKMWKMVIETARRLDVQVFATTHSLDCIRALGWLCENEPGYQADVRVHRIDKGIGKAATFSGEDIVLAVESRIEVRG